MQLARSRLISAAVAIGMLLLWLSPPGSARALEVDVAPDGFAVVAVPAVPGATQLWIDVEAAGLVAEDVVATLDGDPVTLLQTPFGAGTVLVHDGAAATLAVGLAVDADPDIAITLADPEGRILLTDSSRVRLSALRGDQRPPTSQPTVTAEPPATSPPPSSPPGSPQRPTPGLPSTGVSDPMRSERSIGGGRS